MNTKQNNSKIIYLSVLIILILVAVGGYNFYLTRKNMGSSLETTTTNNTKTGKISGYKNGTYNVEGVYMSPVGSESIAVQIELENNIITSASVTPLATNPTSKQMQKAFVEGYKTLVVGKSLDEVSLNKVSGASLTTKGFNDAINKIKVLADQNKA